MTKNIKQKILMYTTSWCSDCHRSKRFLDEYGIEYVEIDVEKNAEGLEFVKKVNHGNRVVPTIVFQDGDILVEPPNAALALKLQLEESAEDSFPV